LAHRRKIIDLNADWLNEEEDPRIMAVLPSPSSGGHLWQPAIVSTPIANNSMINGTANYF